jgi:hypothetical protein
MGVAELEQRQVCRQWKEAPLVRKKIVALVFAGALLVCLAVPLFGGVGAALADQPDNPGCAGEVISAQGQAGIRSEVVAWVKADTSEKNFGQTMKAWHRAECDIPSGHTP